MASQRILKSIKNCGCSFMFTEEGLVLAANTPSDLLAGISVSELENVIDTRTVPSYIADILEEHVERVNDCAFNIGCNDVEATDEDKRILAIFLAESAARSWTATALTGIFNVIEQEVRP